MADALKDTLAVGAGASTVTGLTEHGQVKVGISGKVKIEQDLDDGDWDEVYEGRGPIVVLDYVGTTLRFTNTGDTVLALRVGQVG